MITLYIYDADTMTLIARITGDDNSACERIATERFGDTDAYGWTYSPAFGCTDGLIPGDDVEDIYA